MDQLAAVPNGRALRVVFDHQIFAAQIHGGISRYFIGLAEHLSEFAVDSRIVAPLYFTNRLKSADSVSVYGKHVSWSPRKVVAAQRLGEHLQRPLANMLRADIVHETYFHRARLAPKSSKLVLTVYDMIFELNPGIPDAEVTIRNKRLALERADHIICISESTRRDLLQFYPHLEDRASVTLLGFDSDFRTELTMSRPHGRPYILYVGMRRDYKNFAGLLSAYASSTRLQNEFDLVCVGHQAFNSDELDEINTLGLLQKVHSRSAHNDTELRNWYSHAAVFAYPSLYEGFGIPPLEAMASGCPVVCMNISSVPEVCGPAAEYGEPDKPDSIRVALENVVFSEQRSAALREAGLKQMRRFSWRECARQTSDVYRSLM